MFKDEIYVIAGKGESGILNDIWKLKNGSVWTLITSSAAFSPRFEHASVVHNGFM